MRLRLLLLLTSNAPGPVSHRRPSPSRAFAPYRCALAAIALASSISLFAEEKLPAELEGVGVTEHLGAQVDLSLTFIAENGYPVQLGSYFHKGKPVILDLVYYRCPMLCNLVMNGQTSALRELAWTAGNEFDIVTISIDPKETFNLAKEKKQFYLESYERRVNGGWHFLVDEHDNVKKLADQVGFHYKYAPSIEQYAHAAAVMVLTPEGKVSRYLYGIKLRSRDLRLALTEASESKLGISFDRFLLYCFHYDPQAKSYVIFATNIMRAGGVLIVLVLGFTIWHLFKQEKKLEMAR